MVPRGTPHGLWYLGVEQQIIVHWDHQGRKSHLKKHVYKQLNNMVNAYQLTHRGEEETPNKFHVQRALLIQNSVHEH